MMNKLRINTRTVALVAALAVGVAACNRSQQAGPPSGAAVSASVPSPALGQAPAAGQALAPGQAPAPVQALAPVQAPAPAPPQRAPVPDNGLRYARVIGVQPVRQSVNNPQQVCHDEVITHTAPPRDEHRLAGTAIGAVAGGLLGHLIGGGRGNTLTTVAGAVGGGYAGNRIEASHQQGQVTQTVERRCDTVDHASSKVVAFDVRYVYNGVTRKVRMDHDPGDRVQVKEGVTVVSGAR